MSRSNWWPCWLGTHSTPISNTDIFIHSRSYTLQYDSTEQSRVIDLKHGQSHLRDMQFRVACRAGDLRY